MEIVAVLLMIVLAWLTGFMMAVWGADKVWKCCPCVDGVPDCTERDRKRRMSA